MFVGFLRIVSVFAILAGVLTLVYRVWKYASDRERRYGSEEPMELKINSGFPITLFFVGVVALIMLSGAAQIAPTHVGVVENTWTGQFFVLEPGTHIWPFEPRLTPMITRVFSYNLRRQIISIGEQPVREQGVQADSNSPGRPVVYFYARGWASPNKDRIIDLHRLYGENYQDDWVERVWVSTLKAIQGDRPYDYVGNERVGFQDEVERALQQQLVDQDGNHLVFVSQLAIVDFDFSDEVNAYLDAVAQKEFERQQAEQQILINQKNQEAQTIEAETNYIVTKRNAEASQVERVTQAQGQADAQRELADAQAYEIRELKSAEAEGIRAIQQAIATSPESYLEYLRAIQWDGELPITMLGSTPLPFLNIPMPEDSGLPMQ